MKGVSRSTLLGHQARPLSVSRNRVRLRWISSTCACAVEEAGDQHFPSRDQQAGGSGGDRTRKGGWPSRRAGGWAHVVAAAVEQQRVAHIEGVDQDDEHHILGAGHAVITRHMHACGCVA
jgi:hypothetical protein